MPEAAEDTAPAEQAALEAPPSSSAPPAPEAAPDPYDDPDTDRFDRPYVEKLRQESAKHRTAYQPYRDAFDGYDDASREFLLDLARDLKSDDPAVRAEAGKRMRAVGEKLSPAEQAALEGEEAPPVEVEDKPLTRAELDAIFKEREAIEQQDREVRAVYDEAESLGYKQDTRELADLLYIATHETKGDLKAAHDLRLKSVQSVVDDFVRQQQEASGELPVVSTAGGAPAPSAPQAPKTLKEAAAATSRRLDREFGPR